jgi:excinuclease UvrABC helicase subunit UvrB
MLGEGNPDGIHRLAKQMTPNVYRKLIAIGGRKEVNLHFESRAAIMKREEELSQEITDAVADRDFDRAHELQGVYDELDALKKRFPDLNTLKQESDSLSYDIEKAIIDKDWIRARDVHAVLEQVQRKIQVEKDALLAFGIMYTHEDENDILKTRTCIDAKLEELTRELDEAADANDFKKAAEIDVDLQRLEELKPL